MATFKLQETATCQDAKLTLVVVGGHGGSKIEIPGRNTFLLFFCCMAMVAVVVLLVENGSKRGV